MFRKKGEPLPAAGPPPDRVDSVLGAGIAWKGEIHGQGGVRIEGAFDGTIAVRGLLVIAEGGRVTSEHIRAVAVVVGGSLKGDITAQRVEIKATGRVWGNVVTTSFSTEEGAFLRGQITMEDELDLGFGPAEAVPPSEVSEEPQQSAPGAQ